jgi:cytosine/adenosine deaminase-related metal-dependent hydrolase
MSTLNGAKALGLQGEAGSLEAGKRADWISLPWNGKKESLAEHAIGSLEPVSCVFLGGKEISRSFH